MADGENADAENARLRARIVELEDTLREVRTHHSTEPAALQDMTVGLHAERTKLIEMLNRMIEGVDRFQQNSDSAERPRIITTNNTIIENHYEKWKETLTETTNRVDKMYSMFMEILRTKVAQLDETNKGLIETNKLLIKTHHIERMKLVNTVYMVIDKVSTKVDGWQDFNVLEYKRLSNLQQRIMTHPKPVSRDNGIALVVTEMAGGVFEVRFIVGQRKHVSKTVANAVQDGAREMLKFKLVGNGIALRNNFVREANRRLVEALGGRAVSTLSVYVYLFFYNTTVSV